MEREFTYDKVVNEMGRDGLLEHNLSTDETKRVSERFEDYQYRDTGNLSQEFSSDSKFSEKKSDAETHKSANEKYKSAKEKFIEKFGNLDVEEPEQAFNADLYEDPVSKNKTILEKKIKSRVEADADPEKTREAFSSRSKRAQHMESDSRKQKMREEAEQKMRERYAAKVAKREKILHPEGDSEEDIKKSSDVRKKQQQQERAQYIEPHSEQGSDGISKPDPKHKSGVKKAVRRYSNEREKQLYNDLDDDLEAKSLELGMRRTSKVFSHVAEKQYEYVSGHSEKKKGDAYSNEKKRYERDDRKYFERANEQNDQEEMKERYEEYQSRLREKMQDASSAGPRINRQQKRFQDKKYKEEREETLQTVKKNFQAMGKKTLEIINANKKVIAVTLGIVGGIYLLISSTTSVITIGTEMAVDSVAQFAAGLFVASQENMADCTNYLTEKLSLLVEDDFMKTEELHPGFDEYQYWINGAKLDTPYAFYGKMRFDNVQLASFLSTKVPEYDLTSTTTIMDDLFDSLYTITREEVIERRTRDVFNESGGFLYTEEWDCHIWKTSVESKSITEVAEIVFSADELSQYKTFTLAEGNLQMYGSPLEGDWRSKITSQFGHRARPTAGASTEHKGMDIGIPVGTKIYSVMDGVVTTAATGSATAGNWVAIKTESGFVSKYMHCSTLLVSAGQQVKRGQCIALSGNTGVSTGPHLHLQIENAEGKAIDPRTCVAQIGYPSEEE